MELGIKVRDKVSGFVGVTVARHTYLNGCNRWSVQPPVDKEGKLPESVTFDEPNLEVVLDVDTKIAEDHRTGGPEKYMPSKRPGE